MSNIVISATLDPATVRRPACAPFVAVVASTLLLAVLILLPWGVQPDKALAASAPAVNQCNGTDNVGGQAVACDVTVTNNLDLTTGVTSSILTTRECHGAAGDANPVCIFATTPSAQLVTSVTQCDGSGSGGGGTVTCNASIVNNITGVATASPATINQCIGTGQGGGIEPTTSCSPLGATTGATITQCNGSGNGGGGTMRVRCTVTPSTETSALFLTVDQCNGSGNGGGSLVTCTVSLTNNVIAPAATTTTPPTTTPLIPPLTTPLPETGAPTSSMVFVALLAVAVGALAVVLSRGQARSVAAETSE